ncbi:MAG: tetratricopeptide repeat protein [Alphaproteobacteria bacterium]
MRAPSARIPPAFAQAEAAADAGDLAGAAAAYEEALRAAPGVAPGWAKLGHVRMRQGHVQAAVEAFARAVEVDPHKAVRHYNLGFALAAAGDLVGAERAYRRAIQIDPRHARAHNNLGDLLRRRGAFIEADAALRNAIRLDPDYDLARLGLGHTLVRRRLGKAAVDVLSDLARRRPDDPQVHQSLALAYDELGDVERADAAYGRAIALRDVPAWRVHRRLLLPAVLDSIADRDRARRRYAEGISALDAEAEALPADALPGAPFRLCYQGLDDRPLQEALARVLRRRFPELTFASPHIGRPRPPGRFRIAIVSASLRLHTVGKLMGALIDRLRGPEFEVSLFQSGRLDDSAAAIAAGADRSVRLDGPLAARRQAIAATAPDLVLYPEIGMDQATRYLAFARLAPVQAVMWGHPVTTGIDTIDHFLSAADHEPADGDRHYSERLVRLPAMPMVVSAPPPPAPFDRARFGIPAGVPLLSCPQSPFKIHPDSDALFAAALRAAPSTLLVIPHWVEPVWVDRIHRRFALAYPDVAARMIHPPRLSHPDYLALVADSVALVDPAHFTGGQTTLEAFALGTPVLTLPGRFLRGRLTYGFYRRLGIDDAIARDPADHAHIAGRLVADGAWRNALADRIRARTAERLIGDLSGAQALRDYVTALAGLDRSAIARQKPTNASSIAAPE